MGDNKNVNQLPPGFRFYPTDEELILHFLHTKASLLPSHADVIPDLHLYSYDPWELHGRALAEGNQWYYYSRRTKDRVTSNGYWKPTGIEEQVVSTTKNKRVGIKKQFVFHVVESESPAGIRTNWIMQEYRLSDSASSTKWVICCVYEEDDDGTDQLSCLDEVFLSMDDLDEISLPN